jgi:uncharacterized protein (DUF697 family)
VLATDVIRAPAIAPETIGAVARRVAVRAPEAAWALAARLPPLRDGVSQALVRRYALRNAVVSAATFVPGPDLPALAANEIRMALRLATARGSDSAAMPVVAFAAAVGGGLALRGLARRLSALMPLPAWAIQAAVAYAGTRALGEAVGMLARSERGGVRPRC